MKRYKPFRTALLCAGGLWACVIIFMFIEGGGSHARRIGYAFATCAMVGGITGLAAKLSKKDWSLKKFIGITLLTWLVLSLIQALGGVSRW